MGKPTGTNSVAAKDSIGSVAGGESNGTNISMGQIFADVSGINPSTSSISSLGEYVSQSQQMIADARIKEIMPYVSKESLAYKILTDPKIDNFSVKQRWVIAYELAKNPAYKADLERRNAETRAFDERQRAARHARNERRQERANAYAASQGLRSITKGERIITGSTVYDKYGNASIVTKRSGDIFYIKDENGKVTSQHKSKIYLK